MSLISLVGLPGSGKSSVGRQLARRLQIPFFDSDHLIETQIGCSVRDYFAREGELSFRNIEIDVIESVAKHSEGILSTGGGVVISQENRFQLKNFTRVIYLKSNPSELFRRLKNDGSRPLLQVANPLARLNDLYDQRDPLYREVAEFVIETGRPSVTTLVNMIVMQIELAGDRSPA